MRLEPFSLKITDILAFFRFLVPRFYLLFVNISLQANMAS